jgi:hypothetical protein
MPTPPEIVRAYCALWNENNAGVRARLLDLCWSEAGAIHIGERTISGKEAVAAEAAQFRAQRPHDEGVLTSGIAFVGRWFRFTGEVHRLDGSVYSRFLDVGEFGSDGRIQAIITFPREA